jgi:hypothetical protein
MINSPVLSASTQDTASFIKKYVNILMLFFPITSFVLVPSVPGTTIITVLSALLFITIPLSTLKEEKGKFFLELTYFFCVIIILSFVSQLINLITHLKLSKNLILINKNDYTRTFYRPSHLTQTLSLVVGFIIYGYVKHLSNESIIKYIYWGLRLLCFYALYEFLLYAATGINGDFMANRTLGYDSAPASLFQTFSLGPISLMRLKGYTGEPSMFVFTVFPFWVLTFGLKRRFDMYLLLTCLLLTFSTTAYFFMFLFMGYWFIYKRQYQVFFYMCIFIIVVCFVLQLNMFQHLFDSLYEFVLGGKIGGNSVSSRERGKSFINQIEFWSNLNGFSQAFGIGFGYIRSSDFFSTLLPNNGIIGLLIFSWFVLRNLWLDIAIPILSGCYKIGLIIVYFIMMASVPEFAYPSLWIFIALGFVLKHLSHQPQFKQDLIAKL